MVIRHCIRLYFLVVSNEISRSLVKPTNYIHAWPWNKGQTRLCVWQLLAAKVTRSCVLITARLPLEVLHSDSRFMVLRSFENREGITYGFHLNIFNHQQSNSPFLNKNRSSVWQKYYPLQPLYFTKHADLVVVIHCQRIRPNMSQCFANVF